ALDEWQPVNFNPPTPIAPSSVASSLTTGKTGALLGELLSQVTTTFVVGASATSVSFTPSGTPDGSVPCGLTFDPSVVYCFDGTANSTSLVLPGLDRCDAIAQELKCDVVTEDWGTFGFQMQLNSEPTQANNPPCGNLATQP